MIKIEKVDVYGWEAAIRGMRNPKNSWDKSDSGTRCKTCTFRTYRNCQFCEDDHDEFIIGENDMKLAKTLANAGDDHGKWLRMVTVTMDITAPLYWWKEFDTYKVGTVADSCSTMHKIHSKEFTVDDFSYEHLYSLGTLRMVIDDLNQYRSKYLETKNKNDWWQMIQLLPSSYNQKRTVMVNYQVLKHMYHARRNHKLNEWVDFCDKIAELPYAKEFIIGE